MNIEYKKCSNCEKDIESSKMFLHENFCSKNYKKCTCGEIIEIANEEEHLQTHKKVNTNTNTTTNINKENPHLNVQNINQLDNDEEMAKKMMEEDELLSLALAQSLNENQDNNLNKHDSDEEFAKKLQEDMDKELANQFQNEIYNQNGDQNNNNNNNQNENNDNNPYN